MNTIVLNWAAIFSCGKLSHENKFRLEPQRQRTWIWTSSPFAPRKLLVWHKRRFFSHCVETKFSCKIEISTEFLSFYPTQLCVVLCTFSVGEVLAILNLFILCQFTSKHKKFSLHGAKTSCFGNMFFLLPALGKLGNLELLANLMPQKKNQASAFLDERRPFLSWAIIVKRGECTVEVCERSCSQETRLR